VYQPDTQRTLLAKEGTNGIWPAISQFSKRAGFFYMPQSWDHRSRLYCAVVVVEGLDVAGVCCETVVACVEPEVCDCLFSGFMFLLCNYVTMIDGQRNTKYNRECG
jgi:hypothetical protein